MITIVLFILVFIVILILVANVRMYRADIARQAKEVQALKAWTNSIVQSLPESVKRKKQDELARISVNNNTTATEWYLCFFCKDD